MVHAQPLVGSLELIAPHGVFSVDYKTSTSSVWGLNNAGQVLVNANDSTGAWRPGLWTSGGFSEIVNTLPDSSGSVYVSGISESGQVVGTVGDRGFVWSGGTMTELSNPSAYGQFFPEAINDSGHIVSTVSTYEGATIYKQSGGTTVTLPAGATGNAGIGAINNAGQVAGWSRHAESETTRATLWNDAGEVTFLPTLNPNGDSYAYDLNENGVVVGSFFNEFGTEHAFIWDGDSVVDIGALFESPFQSSVAYGVNAHGQVVGYGYGAFLYENGTVYNLEELAAGFLVEEGTTSGFVALSVAYEVNDFGQIVGTGTYYDSETDQTYDMSFLMTLAAVPEPATATALTGLIALGTVAARRRRRIA